jgi:hypothetical protein
MVLGCRQAYPRREAAAVPRFRGYFTFRGIDLTPTLGVPRLQSPPPAAGGVMPASQATGLPGLADRSLVCSLGDELVVTLAHHFVGDIGMHDLLLTVCSALAASLITSTHSHIRAHH